MHSNYIQKKNPTVLSCMFPITATERLQDLQWEEPAQLVQEMVHSYFPGEPCLTSCPNRSNPAERMVFCCLSFHRAEDNPWKSPWPVPLCSFAIISALLAPFTQTVCSTWIPVSPSLLRYVLLFATRRLFSSRSNNVTQYIHPSFSSQYISCSQRKY